MRASIPIHTTGSPSMSGTGTRPLLRAEDDLNLSLSSDRTRLAERYEEVRRQTELLCATLETEDYVVQSMPDASPAKWHLAHTSWFFETLVLKPGGSEPDVSAQYAYLFNSYYNSLGERIPRVERGLLTRPTVAEVYAYRAAIDEGMRRFLDRAGADTILGLGPNIVLGLHHEQQHQELLLTDLKHLFHGNPLRPVYREQEPTADATVEPLGWVEFPAGLRRIGHDGPGFAFDNEGPRHSTYLAGFRLADRLVTNGEYRRFIDEGGYDRPEFWLSDGWNVCKARRWEAPLYWEKAGTGWRLMTLAGMRYLTDGEPACHVSYYEADAYARWAGARLPNEAEWEIAAEPVAIPADANFLESGRYHPIPLTPVAEARGLAQLFGDTWEWTCSPYSPYPGYRPFAGALGEYNSKFMCNQIVLRGGSCATPRSHVRPSYRNFFPPDARWQFSGFRLAQDA
jgi:ergothioneine biosynthesis protein EgtB